jgi:putative ABC transport system permease protein
MRVPLHDIGYAFRALRRAPVFTGVAVLILTLGIGATTTIFSIVRTVLLQSLPFPDPDRVLLVAETHENDRKLRATPGTFFEWGRRSDVFREMSLYTPASGVMTHNGEAPEELRAGMVMWNYFSVLAARPLLGRTFQPEDTAAMILSHALWVRRFGGDDQILGKTVTLDDDHYKVVGIMPPGFDLPQRAACWVPLVLTDDSKKNLGSHYLWAVGRLKGGISLPQAQAEMNAVAAKLAKDIPKYKEGWGVNLMTLQESIVGNVRPALLLFQWAVLAVLLIACANVVNLQIVRLLSRKKELAVRSSLGAGPGRLFAETLWESVLLSLASGALGMLFAWAALRFVKVYKTGEIPRLAEAALDPRMLGFTLVLALAIGVLLGAVVAVYTSRDKVSEDLKDGGGRVVGSGRGARDVLVVIEVCCALVLLVGATLLGDSFAKLSRIDPGVRPEHVVALPLDIPDSRYPDIARRQLFFSQLLAQLGGLPAVRAVGLINNLPAAGKADWKNAFYLEGDSIQINASSQKDAFIRWTSPGYFKSVGMRLLRGRDFTNADLPRSPRVLIVDEAFAHKYFPGQDPLGKRFKTIGLGDNFDAADPRPWEIVGIVGNVREPTVKDAAEPHYYMTYQQAPFLPDVVVTARTASDPRALMSVMQQRVRAMDPNLVVDKIQPLEQTLGETLSAPRFNFLLIAIFAVVALVLAAAGLYAVLAYSVGQRTREIGLRMALGAQKRDVLAMVLRHGLRVSAIGVLLGLLAVLYLDRLLGSFLYEASSADLPAVLAVAALLMAVGLLATYIPARRAASINPTVALRDR